MNFHFMPTLTKEDVMTKQKYDHNNTTYKYQLLVPIKHNQNPEHKYLTFRLWFGLVCIYGCNMSGLFLQGIKIIILVRADPH